MADPILKMGESAADYNSKEGTETLNVIPFSTGPAAKKHDPNQGPHIEGPAGEIISH